MRPDRHARHRRAAADRRRSRRRCRLVASGLTTPDPVTLHAALRDFADRGCDAVAIEASSIGLAEHRLAATRIDVALFTNLTRDHLDYHGDMEAYWAGQARALRLAGARAAVVDIDDEHGAALADDLVGGAGRHLDRLGARPGALRARGLAYHDGGIGFDVCEGAGHRDGRSRLVGDFNANNLLGVLGALRARGIPA